MKTIYFGKVQPGDDVSDTFATSSGNFYYALEFNEEQIKIMDTCNRSVPIDLDSAEDMLKALQYVTHYIQANKAANEWREKAVERLNKLYGLQL